MTDDTPQHPLHERIRARAYLIWEKEGKPDGHALAHWVLATSQIEAEAEAERAAAAAGAPRRKARS